jgi:hypothetical protein
MTFHGVNPDARDYGVFGQEYYAVIRNHMKEELPPDRRSPDEHPTT